MELNIVRTVNIKNETGFAIELTDGTDKEGTWWPELPTNPPSVPSSYLTEILKFVQPGVNVHYVDLVGGNKND